ncbi:MAG TPA: hypothetical protein VFF06_29865 [Polyangia bacterium]|nr:hypothetical protein [Polyangia bacterium]
MSAPLARDQHGSAFELPQDAAFWRVRRHTGGRPSTVLGPDGEPLFVPIMADRHDLHSQGCAAGSLRLEAVDEEYHPVNAPVAFVELIEPRNAPSSNSGHGDLVRSSNESLTRTMEAMQRAQVERERALAQKERAFADAQVASQRMHMELMVALVERLGGGKPQDQVDVLKKHLAFQKALDQSAPRNALPPAAESAEEASNDNQPGWFATIKPLVPVAAMTAQEFAINAFAKGDPEKAAQLRQTIGMFASALGAFGGLAQQQQGNAAPVAPRPGESAAEQQYADPEAEESSEDEESTRPTPPKAVREVYAQLDDDEMSALSDYLDGLDDEQYGDLIARVTLLPALDERTAYMRRLIHRVSSEPSSAAKATASQPPTGISAIPPGLVPVLAGLSPEESQIGLQLLPKLDPRLLQKLTASLLAMPVEQAIATLKQHIADAHRSAA